MGGDRKGQHRTGLMGEDRKGHDKTGLMGDDRKGQDRTKRNTRNNQREENSAEL
jgi:hypothetical protein